MSELTFICAFVVTAIVDVVVAIATLRFRERDARSLARSMFAGAFISIVFMMSVIVGDPFAMSVFSSLYFVGIDFVLLSFAGFIVFYIGQGKNPTLMKLRKVALAYFVFDAVVMLANPFDGGLAVGYILGGPAGPYVYDIHLLYLLHLVYCYVMAAFSTVLLIAKTVSVPREYRPRYTMVCFGFLLIVFLNLLYMVSASAHRFDYSVLLYGFMGIFLYVVRFHYSEQAVLTQAHALLVDQMGRAVILFDYEGRFTTLNRDAEQFLSSDQRTHRLRLESFARMMRWEDNLGDLDADTSFYWRTQRDGRLSSWRVDFTLLRDKKSRVVGYLFVMTDDSLVLDILTGFETQAAWERDYAREGAKIEPPCVAAVCDLTRLSLINERFGHNVGDEALALLASEMRAAFPEDSRFVRLSDANLLVVAPDMSEQEGREAMAEVADAVAAHPCGDVTLSVQSCVEAVYDDTQDILEVAHKAFSGLMARKLLVEDSSHASLIASLVQLQRQSDGETEDHVQRTRAIGGCLGRRLGLSDSELNSFALLCLLHDIGKVGVPLEILNKPGRLTEVEREVMQSHATKGYEIASASRELEDVAVLILHHHENWDGSGYPDGLVKEAIPLLSRVVAVVDTFDAMTHDRPYRRAISVEAAKEELRRGAGTQFDPVVTAEFLAMLDENPELVQVDGETGDGTVFDARTVVPVSAIGVVESGADDEGVPSGEAPMVACHYVRYILDSDQRIIEINDEFSNMTGYSESDLETYKLTQADLIPLEDRDLYWKQVEEGLSVNHEVMIEHRLRKKDGSYLFVMCFGREYFDVATNQMRSEIVVADLRMTSLTRTLLREAQEKSLRSQQRWEETLRRDVTGVLTRMAFRDDVQIELMDPDTKVLMAIIDLDFFKQYNDAKGHPQGDALLMRLGSLLSEETQGRGIAGRLGGDEFAAAFAFEADASDDEIRRAAYGLWEAVDGGLYAYDGVHVTMGAAMMRGGDATYSALYSRADAVLYRAKILGRARCEVTL